GPDWASLSSQPRTTVFTLAQGVIRDAIIRPVEGGRAFVAIIERRDGSFMGALAADPLRFDDPQPLALDTEAPPRCPRLFMRGRRYWLLTFLRERNGRPAIFWGVIDWEQSPL